MEGVISRLRSWWAAPTGSEFDPDDTRARVAGDAPARPFGNIDRTDDPRVRARIAEEADRLSSGYDVAVPREVANLAENLIIHLFDTGMIDEVRHGSATLRYAAVRRALSDAITRADEEARPWKA